ncbi:hypothetical protein HKD37_10G028662 [Glycine soja]
MQKGFSDCSTLKLNPTLLNLKRTIGVRATATPDHLLLGTSQFILKTLFHVEDHVNGEDDSDSNSLLPPRRGGMSRNCEKTRRKVQWNDRNGNKLAEVLEYEPRYSIGLELGGHSSDVSDSEDEDSDSCICAIM